MNQVIDITEPVILCALDVLCETAMGVETNVQEDSNSSFVRAIREIQTSLIVYRMKNIFLYIDFIYKFSNTKRRYDKVLKIVHDFGENVILSRREELMRSNEFAVDFEDIDVGVKRKIAFLDILLKSTIDRNPLSNAEIQEEVDTFMAAGFDTTAGGIYFCLYNLAKYSEIQDRVFEEVQNVMSDDLNKTLTLSDLNSMNYLEMVIKESLRLYAPAVLYGRKLEKNLEMNGKLIPGGANVFVSIFAMGRNEELWEDPLEFKPDRFSVDAPLKHPFQFLPFSAGPRNCIGQKFAMLEMKSIISKILRNFELTLEAGFEPILIYEITLHSLNGVKLLINKRKY